MSAVGLLGVVFVTLKLLGIVAWSWVWVTMPFWGVFVLYMLPLLGIFLKVWFE